MEEMFLRILNMGVTAGYCILVVIVLRLCMKRLPKVYSYALWSVVYFRLVCPVSVSSVFSLLKIRPKTLQEKIGAQASVHVADGLFRDMYLLVSSACVDCFLSHVSRYGDVMR